MKDLAVTVTNSLGILGDCSYCAYVASIDGNPHATPPEKLHAQKVEKEHGIVIERLRGGQFRSLVRTVCVCQGAQWGWVECRNLCVCQGVQWSWVECRNFYSKWQPHLIYIYIYICHSHVLHFITAHTSGHAQLRARCAGEDAVPSTCVGGARPCAGRGAGRARSAACPAATAPSPSEPGPGRRRPCTCTALRPAKAL